MSSALPVLHEGRARRADFDAALEARGLGLLARGSVKTLQINVGRLCNQACHHCHVEAGPKRTEVMPRRVAERAMALLAATPSIEIVDITGGAPELCPSFRWLVTESRRLGRRVIDRCNLTILFEPGQEDLAEFLARSEVAVVASLPCYLEENVDKQRGHGVFKKSIDALRRLNALGYGRAVAAPPGRDESSIRSGAGAEAPAGPTPRTSSMLELDLVYNPIGAYLPPAQAELEADYHDELRARFGIEFGKLFTITNMPVKRFADSLDRTGEYEAYMGLLVNHFNPGTVGSLMCRSLVSIGWDGRLYDCDFNQMLEIPLGAAREVRARTVFEIDSLEGLTGGRIATGSHCFGCTAGAGSSCGGAIA